MNSKFKHRTNELSYWQSLIDERSTYQHKKTLDFIGVDPDKTKNKLTIVSFLDTYCTIIEEKGKLNYETIHVKCHACDGAPCKGHHGETKSEVVLELN